VSISVFVHFFQSLNAKASLAAFLQSQSQQQQQQQIVNFLQQQQQQQSAVNNKNSNNNNNKKNNTKSIVLGQQQAAFVLNQLNLQKQKPAAINGISGHQRLVLMLSLWLHILGCKVLKIPKNKLGEDGER
jgi:hypothetical protein